MTVVVESPPLALDHAVLLNELIEAACEWEPLWWASVTRKPGGPLVDEDELVVASGRLALAVRSLNGR